MGSERTKRMTGGSGGPTWLVLVLAGIGMLGGGGGLVALYGARVSHRLGVKANEREARVDELTAEDRLIGRLEHDRDHEQGLRFNAERELRREREYVEVLRHWIWEGRGAPPPARPSDNEGASL